jgi:hypothetical protein
VDATLPVTVFAALPEDTFPDVAGAEPEDPDEPDAVFEPPVPDTMAGGWPAVVLAVEPWDAS